MPPFIHKYITWQNGEEEIVGVPSQDDEVRTRAVSDDNTGGCSGQCYGSLKTGPGVSDFCSSWADLPSQVLSSSAQVINKSRAVEQNGSWLAGRHQCLSLRFPIFFQCKESTQKVERRHCVAHTEVAEALYQAYVTQSLIKSFR